MLNSASTEVVSVTLIEVPIKFITNSLLPVLLDDFDFVIEFYEPIPR